MSIIVRIHWILLILLGKSCLCTYPPTLLPASLLPSRHPSLLLQGQAGGTTQEEEEQEQDEREREASVKADDRDDGERDRGDAGAEKEQRRFKEKGGVEYLEQQKRHENFAGEPQTGEEGGERGGEGGEEEQERGETHTAGGEEGELIMSEVGNAQEKEEKDGGAFEQEEEVAIGELMETGVELEEGGSEEAIDLGASCASDLHQDPLYLQEVESQLESFWVEHMAAQQQQAAAASVLAVTTRGEGGREEGRDWMENQGFVGVELPSPYSVQGGGRYPSPPPHVQQPQQQHYPGARSPQGMALISSGRPSIPPPPPPPPPASAPPATTSSVNVYGPVNVFMNGGMGGRAGGGEARPPPSYQPQSQQRQQQQQQPPPPPPSKQWGGHGY